MLFSEGPATCRRSWYMMVQSPTLHGDDKRREDLIALHDTDTVVLSMYYSQFK